MIRIRYFLPALLLAVSLPVLAAGADAPKAAAPNADDPVIEARLVELAEDLRCLVCQNESLAGSKAALAEDLRREIREQMKAGKDDREVVAYLTERYGDFVLYKPPFKPVTWLLWLGPVLFLGIGGGAWYLTLRRRGVETPPVDETRRAAAAQLLKEDS
ncbi:MAG: cytochrome c-type biogenesis protein [Thiobacillus sp.]|jgi:cytochrome c-type biogenesis protein CcmH|uniref:cytochrome c-type biogenesis protein n=1 Tax=Thiobacillus sp. TaxID=924 RepID=UPI002894BCF5|nr:cytochrome c-type biogenesis protein [Thiobacillus sp.]MDT3705494.1 cytochrome c-type biogenesis protein [Thiobacillus sp.]